MVPDTLDELVSLSNELATLRGKPLAQPGTANVDLHPDLAKVLASGALTLQGVDTKQMTKFSADARSRGMRRNAVVFGWPRAGTKWFASPEKHDAEARVWVINRLDRLSMRDLSLAEFVDLCIEEIRAEIVVQNTAPVEPEIVVPGTPAPAAARQGRRPLKVVLPESAGASVIADGRTEVLKGPELAYIFWCMTGLQMLSDGQPPDLSRWQERCLRACRIDKVPGKKAKARAEYDAHWARLTLRERSASGPVHHQVQGWKLTAPGSWILSPNESEVLRRAAHSTPPRHVPTEDQAAIWARWMAIVEADEVELHVR